LIVLIKISASWGLADIENQKVRVSINRWENDIDSYSTEDWDKTFSYTKTALEKDPYNPDLLSLMANIYEWNSFQGDDQLQNNQRAQLALEYYRKAVELRPQWPYTWSSIALLKYKMSEFDQELRLALINATELGPWEPNVQKIVAEIGLHSWNDLAHSQRIMIVENIKRGVTMQPRVMLEILKKYGQLRMVCYDNNKPIVVEQYCKRNKEEV
jgi:tetratricopeptide (TPR) repeat protein